MKTRLTLLLLFFSVGKVAFTQTTVPLAGACTDCAAVITAFNNCSVASAGTLKAGTMVDTGVTQTIQLTVGKVGKYSLSTTNNGVTFAASGTFTALGLQTVALTASGYTVSGGTTTFTLSSKSQSCTFDRAVGGPTTVITGPCPSNLKFWKTDRADNRYALSKDSVWYAMPYVVYGINGMMGVLPYSQSYWPVNMIMSPTRIQNVPKMVEVAANYAVGIDGHIYFIIETVNNYVYDSRLAGSFTLYNYPYSYVGPVNPYDETMNVFKFPLPPTGTKWVDVCGSVWGYTGGTIFALNDIGEIYLLRGGPYETGAPHLVKLPVPLGTNPVTFKYTNLQVSIGVVFTGNDGNYYSTNGLGWGEDALTAPASDFDSMTNIYGGGSYLNPPTVPSQIRKMRYPSGTMLAEGSINYTVDGKLFIWGQIAETIYNVSTGKTLLSDQRPVYFKYPLKDGDYSYNRPDIQITNDRYITCVTPREIALPAGATKFISSEIRPGFAAAGAGKVSGTGLGSVPLIALTDNGSYGLHPQKMNNYFPENGLSNMELAGVTTSVGANIYYPKYVPSLPGFAAYHIPRNAYGLGLDGTYYTVVDGLGDSLWGYSSATFARYQETRFLQGGIMQNWSDRPAATTYSLLLNGNCDANNPSPEP